MKLQFHTKSCSCLQQLKRELQYQEQTQEIRLPDGMPDIGRVIGAWGQPLIRSKEWRSGGIGVSGGVMAWVLYQPEDGGEPQSLEAWLPFQMKWELPEADRDGTIQASCLLKSVDARMTSSRKLMVRANIGVVAEAYVQNQAMIPMPEDVPEDICLLTRTYPVSLPVESGEKHFELDEEFTMPSGVPPMEKVIYHTIQPEITEHKVMAGKVVFRGALLLHIVYRAAAGKIHSVDFDFPFSMYTELEQEHNETARAKITPMLTGLELESAEDGKLHLKAGLVGQYLIYGQHTIDIVEDAYSPKRDVMLFTEELQLPVLLDSYSQTIRADQSTPLQGTFIADINFCPDHLRVMRCDGAVEIESPGQFQMLYYDDSGVLQGQSAKWEIQWSLPMAEECRTETLVLPTGRPQAVFVGTDATVQADILVDIATICQQSLHPVSALEIGEMKPEDVNRPSLLLRRYDDSSLWELAKETGTTPEAIKDANRLDTEPAYGQILLIPLV